MTKTTRRIATLFVSALLLAAVSLVAGVATADAKPRDPYKGTYCYYGGGKFSPGATIRMGNTLRYCSLDGTWREMWDQ